MQKYLILIGLLTCTSLFSPGGIENQPTTRQPERGSGRKELMDKTFIKTSERIIRLEHISEIHISPFIEGKILIGLTNGNNIILAGEEAQLFLQFIPIAIDLSKFKKEESGVEIAGLRM